MKKNNQNIGNSTMSNETSSNVTQSSSQFSVNSMIQPVQQKNNNSSIRATVKTIKSTATASKTNAVPESKSMSNVEKIERLISEYEKAYFGDKSTIQHWVNLCNFLNATNDPKVYQTFYVWFAKNMEGVTHNTVALAGIHTLQNLKVKTMVSSIHQCFQELARVLKSGKGHFRFTARSMQILGISPDLSRWFNTRGNR